VTGTWTHLPMVSAPFADFTWRHARRLATQAGLDNTNETDVARVLDELLTRAQAGPAGPGLDKASARVAARTRAANARRSAATDDVIELHPEPAGPTGTERQQVADVIPLGVFDADTEAERWL
jgi:putative transposase